MKVALATLDLTQVYNIYNQDNLILTQFCLLVYDIASSCQYKSCASCSDALCVVAWGDNSRFKLKKLVYLLQLQLTFTMFACSKQSKASSFTRCSQ